MLTYLIVFAFICAAGLAFALTPLVKKFAVSVGAMDKPDARKVHSRLMPRLGGLAIYAAFVGTFGLISPLLPESVTAAAAVKALLVGGGIIVLLGALDDRFELSAKTKLLGQIIAAAVVVIGFDLKVEFVNVPFGDVLAWEQMEWLAIVLTMLWIVGITNAINLIDGLDGLAAGVSAIATATMLVLAVMMGNVAVIVLSALLLGCLIGFLFFNFHPAKIFMGDSGSLFLGFSLATLSILGFKSATLLTFAVPLLILGVPVSDTLLAILRRWVNKKPLSVADKSHLHHCLLQLGFGHRKTVLIIYGIASVFGLSAVFSAYLMLRDMTWMVALIALALLVVLELGAEAIGIISKGKKPVWSLIRRVQIITVQFFQTK